MPWCSPHSPPHLYILLTHPKIPCLYNPPSPISSIILNPLPFTVPIITPTYTPMIHCSPIIYPPPTPIQPVIPLLLTLVFISIPLLFRIILAPLLTVLHCVYLYPSLYKLECLGPNM